MQGGSTPYWTAIRRSGESESDARKRLSQARLELKQRRLKTRALVEQCMQTSLMGWMLDSHSRSSFPSGVNRMRCAGDVLELAGLLQRGRLSDEELGSIREVLGAFVEVVKQRLLDIGAITEGSRTLEYGPIEYRMEQIYTNG